MCELSLSIAESFTPSPSPSPSSISALASMAPKREKSLLEDPPAASTSEDEEVEEEEVEDEEEIEEEEGHEIDEEEEEEEEDDEEEEEEEDDEEATTGKPDSSSAVKKPKSDSTPSSGSKPPQTPSSNDEEEEEDESEESDSEPTPPKLKPLGTSRSSNPSGGKPIVSQPKKTVAKPSTTTTPTKPSATVKRPLESENDSKRKKKKVDDEDSNLEESEKRSTFGPKNIFQRLWSDEDEIVVLRGMIEFKKKGVDPFYDLGEFLDSIKKSLHVEVRTEQLNNKIKRLKKKYLNNYKRGKGDEDPVFSKPHDVISYELMKEIWGGKEGNIRENNGTVVANGKKSNSKKSNNATKTLSLSDISMRESSRLDERNGSLHPCVQEMVHSRDNMVGGSFLKEGLGLIGDSKSKDLEKKWRSLYAAELQLYLRRVELVREQTIAILDAHKSSDT